MKKLLFLLAINVLLSSTSFSMDNLELPFDPIERSTKCTNLLNQIPTYTFMKEQTNIKQLRFAYRSIKEYFTHGDSGMVKELANQALGWIGSLNNLNDEDKATFVTDWQQIAAQFSDSDSN